MISQKQANLMLMVEVKNDFASNQLRNDYKYKAKDFFEKIIGETYLYQIYDNM